MYIDPSNWSSLITPFKFTETYFVGHFQTNKGTSINFQENMSLIFVSRLFWFSLCMNRWIHVHSPKSVKWKTKYSFVRCSKKLPFFFILFFKTKEQTKKTRTKQGIGQDLASLFDVKSSHWNSIIENYIKVVELNSKLNLYNLAKIMATSNMEKEKCHYYY